MRNGCVDGDEEKGVGHSPIMKAYILKGYIGIYSRVRFASLLDSPVPATFRVRSRMKITRFMISVLATLTPSCLSLPVSGDQKGSNSIILSSSSKAYHPSAVWANGPTSSNWAQSSSSVPSFKQSKIGINKDEYPSSRLPSTSKRTGKRETSFKEWYTELSKQGITGKVSISELNQKTKEFTEKYGGNAKASQALYIYLAQINVDPQVINNFRMDRDKSMRHLRLQSLQLGIREKRPYNVLDPTQGGSGLPKTQRLARQKQRFMELIQENGLNYNLTPMEYVIKELPVRDEIGHNAYPQYQKQLQMQSNVDERWIEEYRRNRKYATRKGKVDVDELEKSKEWRVFYPTRKIEDVVKEDKIIETSKERNGERETQPPSKKLKTLDLLSKFGLAK